MVAAPQGAMPAIDLWKDCPGYAEAAQREDEIRSLAFLGRPEMVGGVPCAPLTLRRLQWLQMAKSPLLGDFPAEELAGHPQIKYHLRLFFWVTAPNFKPGAERRKIRTLRAIYKKLPRNENGHDLAAILAAIADYMEKMWLDAGESKDKKRSFFSSTAAVTGFFHKNFGLEIDTWNDSPLRNLIRRLTGRPNPLDIPLPIIWQLQRVHTASVSDTIFTNKLSDRTWKAMLSGMNKRN